MIWICLKWKWSFCHLVKALCRLQAGRTKEIKFNSIQFNFIYRFIYKSNSLYHIESRSIIFFCIMLNRISCHIELHCIAIAGGIGLYRKFLFTFFFGILRPLFLIGRLRHERGARGGNEEKAGRNRTWGRCVDTEPLYMGMLYQVSYPDACSICIFNVSNRRMSLRPSGLRCTSLVLSSVDHRVCLIIKN